MGKMAKDQSSPHHFLPFQPRKLLHLSFGRYFYRFSVRQNFLIHLVDENKGIYKGNEGLGFNETFGQPVDQVGCSSISPKWKWSDLKFSM